MKLSLVAFVMLIPAIVLMSASVALAFYGKEGWGWFLFVGLICTGVSVSSTNETPKERAERFEGND